MDWGTVPPKCEVGDGPNILRSTVIGCEANYELSKKMCQGGIFSEIEVYGQEKGHIRIYVIYQTAEIDKRQTK